MNILWYGNNEGMYRGWWDMGIFEDFFEKATHYNGLKQLPKKESAVVVIPGRALVGFEEQLSEDLNKIPGVVLIIAGDEEGKFDISKIKHDNIKIWVQYPYLNLHDKSRIIGCCYPPELKEFKLKNPTKDIDWFFAGQVTHQRRKLAVEQLRKNKTNGELHESKGFAQGLSREEYYSKMSRAKVVPCPSGPETVDTFRCYEALELGCVPIMDTMTPKNDWSGFWEWLFKEAVPFPQIENYSDLNGYIEDSVQKFPVLNNRCQAFWYRYKAKIKRQIFEDYAEVSGDDLHLPKITTVIPVSPIPSHPDISIISETIKSVQESLPGHQIIVTFDGVRPEQEEKRADYEEHIRRVLWEFPDIEPYIFEEHTHQSGMLKAIIEDIKTPMICYVEHDTPLTTDVLIDWGKCGANILLGVFNVIRFHFEARIPEEHKYLMLDDQPKNDFVRTAQWSQRPHLASTAFYRYVLDTQFSKNSKCFIEDLLHGRLMNDFLKDGELGWNQWRVAIYHPEGGNIKRSYTTDGRAGSKKYDDSQVW